jgi:uncharacterized protein
LENLLAGIIALSLYGGMHVYGYKSLRLAGLPALPLAIVMAVMALGFPVAMATWRANTTLSLIVSRVGFFWVALIGLLFIFLLIGHALYLGLDGIGVNVGERSSWIRLISLAVLVASFAAVAQAYRDPTITRYTVDHSKIYGQGKTISIAHISDLHLGIERNANYLKRVVAMVNAEKPDIIVLTGDTMDTRPEVYAGVAPFLSGFSAPQGVYAVTGNHDFYSGVNDFIRMTQAAGVPVIANEVRQMPSGVQILGVHDGGFGGMRTAETETTRRDLVATLAKLEPGKPSILLQHQPRDLEPAVEKGVDLVLSGHTHNGQVWPFTLFTRFMYKYVAGLYIVSPQTSVIVSQGTGIWGPPMRLLTHSEIVIVEFKY